ncbi:M24 family metallopeptidase [Nakamurella sp.]|uniref:M24 family metallopeptidase n=1 Tax=Nakamurella sp. TaxID=1869182 RepID=UPI0037847A4E
MTSLHRTRRSTVRAALVAAGIDALLVTDLINVRYLTGFTGSNAALLLVAADDEEPEQAHGHTDRTTDEPDPRTRFCTDGRYTLQSQEQVPDLPRLIARPCDVALLRAAPAGSVGFEARSLPVAAYDTLQAIARERTRPVSLRTTLDVVEDARAVKDRTEIEALERACAVADRALADLIGAGGIRPGRTERAVGLELDQRMRELGAEDPAFETIVAAGANSAVPHHRPTAAVLAAGDFVKLDFGATVDGYHSDMTRTFVLGEPAGWQREIYDLVHAAQAAGRQACVVGATGDAIDAASRDLIAAAGYGPQFAHGLGHGVGLQIHEAPSLARGSASIMAPDMCVTVEPGVYLPGRGGVRIEDSGVIRPDGYHVLTQTSKDLGVL